MPFEPHSLGYAETHNDIGPPISLHFMSSKLDGMETGTAETDLARSNRKTSHHVVSALFLSHRKRTSRKAVISFKLQDVQRATRNVCVTKQQGLANQSNARLFLCRFLCNN
ncbi:uncharacterized protein LAJ45_08279 [Morchella importuna]|uniref:uncharacterized protein n=1 Tax=Morchella importuna TaxID=1174673 RepID=UPI001E8D3205|nr:uncharacterized protein LAJ45_08279 [Morchella importuna]KAH8147813.1 hypothetical protein LAJ45_08279 [Morchella importuna]